MGEFDISTIGIYAVLGVAAAMLVMVNFRVATLTYIGMVLCSALAAPIDWQGNPVTTWMMPIQQRRTEIYALGALLLVLTVFFHASRMRFGRVPFQGILLLIIGLYAGFVRVLASDSPTTGLASMAFALLTVLPALLVVSSLLNEKDDVLVFLRGFALVSAIWIFACVVQFVIRRQVLSPGGGGLRFQGMLGNPQHAGAFLAVITSTCLFLLFNDPKQRYKPAWIVLTGINSVLLLWTGSRTGIGMCTIMASAVLYTRLGSAILLLPIAGGVFFALFSFLESDLGGALSRFGGGGDTRTIAWTRLLDQIRENPVFGVGSTEEARASENSILYGMATYGIFMGILLILFILFTFLQMLRVLVARRKLDAQEKRFADLFVGFNAAYIAGAMFEGYMVSRVSTGLSFMLFFTCLGTWLLGRTKLHREEWHDSGEYQTDLSDSQLALEYVEYGDYGMEDEHAAHTDAHDSRAGH